jgi:hypothetical protein
MPQGGNGTRRLELEDFALLLGISADAVPFECRRIINQFDFRYRPLVGEERDRLILDILKTLHTDLPVSGRNRLASWEDGWSENLQAFVSSNYDLKQLIPGYYRKGRGVMRLFGQYVLPEDSEFEMKVLAVLIAWLGKTFLREVDHVYEFGCGPAHNLVALAEMSPQKSYHGLDWTAPSQQIIETIAEFNGINIDSCRFDMFSPDWSYKLERNSAVVTIGAMEQLGQRFDPFLQYLLKEAPAICVHVEPIYELYDQSNLLDYLAARYSEKRGYLQGYWTALKGLEEAGRIKLLHVQKNLGSQFHDGWTTVAWTGC